MTILDDVNSYNPKGVHRSANTVNAAFGFQDPQSGQKFILIRKQAIHINGPESHILCPMQCHLSGLHIRVPKFLAESPSVTTHAKQLTDPFNAAHQLIIMLQLSRVTSYFDVYSPSIAEYENDELPKIHLTAEEPPWDPSTNKNSKKRFIC